MGQRTRNNHINWNISFADHICNTRPKKLTINVCQKYDNDARLGFRCLYSRRCGVKPRVNPGFDKKQFVECNAMVMYTQKIDAHVKEKFLTSQ